MKNTKTKVDRYHLYKCLLSHDYLTRDLPEVLDEDDEDDFIEFDGREIAPDDIKGLYMRRIESIEYYLTQCIGDFDVLTGEEALYLVNQRDVILDSLRRKIHRVVEVHEIHLCDTFKDILYYFLEIEPDMGRAIEGDELTAEVFNKYVTTIKID